MFLKNIFIALAIALLVDATQQQPKDQLVSLL